MYSHSNRQNALKAEKIRVREYTIVYYMKKTTNGYILRKSCKVPEKGKEYDNME